MKKVEGRNIRFKTREKERNTYFVATILVINIPYGPVQISIFINV